MAGAAAARPTDVSATAGSSPYTGATSGTWTAGTPQLTTSDVLSSDGQAIVVGASCSFTFSGTNGQTNVNGSSTVTLEPGGRALTAAGVCPLVDGDSARDSFGNTVFVASNASLVTD
ncbi:MULTISPECIES: hypothetical protein [Protofrankia]|uniref:Uncharacterized protein n=1 Tax=Candidatus Protofrankia datiscae TaxID=2716812 RepID=F8B1K0_9ACTN|nr:MULTISPECIES: hypothetical protein [Protofrankia]AEH10752.1 hypothetical protein FsymDg_3461 [Candidatus Protofrankia datiscae]